MTKLLIIFLALILSGCFNRSPEETIVIESLPLQQEEELVQREDIKRIESDKRFLRTENVYGDVFLINDEGEKEQIKKGQLINNLNQTIYTGSQSSASFTLQDYDIAYLLVTSNTEFRVKEADVTEEGGRATTILLSKGQVRVKSRELINETSDVRLETPKLSAVVRGTEFGANAVDNQAAIAVKEGSVSVLSDSNDLDNNEQEINLNQGELVYVNTDISNSINRELVLQNPTITYNLSRLENGNVKVTGITEPYNLVYINEELIPKEDGEFSYIVSSKDISSAVIEIISPLGVELSTNIANQSTF